MNRSYRPMLATLVDKPFDARGWVFETKWDGFRIIAKTGEKPLLYSRNGKNVTKQYAPIAEALTKMPAAVIDGELVALDQRGISRFQLLQNIKNTTVPLRYCVFDILFLDNTDVRAHPLLERKKILKKLLPKTPRIRFSAHRATYGRRFFREAQRKGLEGIIGKRAAGRYYSGRRTREWLKIKTRRRQEVVIVGYTKPRRSRTYFGSLVLAVRSGNVWRYAGHVGTGFDSTMLKTLHAKMQKLKTAKRAFVQKIKFEEQTTWVKPALVGEVTFTEWTAAGEMRHPAFVGLRADKKPRDVVRE